jgi:hypothetical protein
VAWKSSSVADRIADIGAAGAPSGNEPPPLFTNVPRTTCCAMG